MGTRPARVVCACVRVARATCPSLVLLPAPGPQPDGFPTFNPPPRNGSPPSMHGLMFPPQRTSPENAGLDLDVTNTAPTRPATYKLECELLALLQLKTWPEVLTLTQPMAHLMSETGKL
ncbi:hypothetical protein C8R44DRAFT_749419 [Mycena epipterygia]|nr:hypothetical protein C8R44DRAFT_749419 [Mycena epipterygia]